MGCIKSLHADMGGMNYRLYIITDETLVPGLSHVRIAAEALSGGATVIQLRDKDKSGGELYAIAREMKALCSEHNALFIVNDRLDIALAADADGVHLGQEDLPLPAARSLAPRPFIIGISAGTVEEAILAEQQGADYIGVGPVYPTGTKPDAGPPVGLSLIRDIADAVTVPVVGIGGINLSNAGAVIQAGADGVAVISAVICSPDITGAAGKFRDLLP